MKYLPPTLPGCLCCASSSLDASCTQSLYQHTTPSETTGTRTVLEYCTSTSTCSTSPPQTIPFPPSDFRSATEELDVHAYYRGVVCHLGTGGLGDAFLLKQIGLILCKRRIGLAFSSERQTHDVAALDQGGQRAGDILNPVSPSDGASSAYTGDIRHSLGFENSAEGTPHNLRFPRHISTCGELKVDRRGGFPLMHL
jgi:hypothetical protein